MGRKNHVWIEYPGNPDWLKMLTFIPAAGQEEKCVICTGIIRKGTPCYESPPLQVNIFTCEVERAPDPPRENTKTFTLNYHRGCAERKLPHHIPYQDALDHRLPGSYGAGKRR